MNMMVSIVYPTFNKYVEFHFQSRNRKSVREALVALGGQEVSPTLVHVPYDALGAAKEVVEKEYPGTYFSETDYRPTFHGPDCRIGWTHERTGYSRRVGYVGKTICFSSGQQSGRRGEPTVYQIKTMLPGFYETQTVATASTQEEAERQAELVLAKVLDWMGVQFKD